MVPKSPTELSKRMQHLNRILDHFWTRWRKEYLTELREAHSHKRNCLSGSEIAVGDIVLVNDPDHPRTFWKLARVMELITSSDGQVRGACIRVGATGSTLRRPTQALYPLEINAPPSDQSGEAQPERVNKSTCPSRVAARTAQQLWREELDLDFD